MATPRMDPSAFVGMRLEEQDGDVLREGAREHRVMVSAVVDSSHRSPAEGQLGEVLIFTLEVVPPPAV